jgi:hypothetical protein
MGKEHEVVRPWGKNCKESQGKKKKEDSEKKFRRTKRPKMSVCSCDCRNGNIIFGRLINPLVFLNIQYIER